MSLLHRLLPGRNFDGDPPKPATPFYAIGDVHGRLDLLNAVIDPLVEEGAPVVLVGDYIDRGEDSAGVLRRLHSLPDHVTCLMGNHEDMLLHFLDKPAKYGCTWFKNGGLQTLASFGIGGLSETSDQDAMTTARDALLTELGPLHEWIQTRPAFWQSGNVGVVHAGADPKRSLQNQPAASLVWGHSDFQKTPRKDGLWIIYGHVVNDDIVIEDGRVGIDTGAYATGRLTAIRVSDGEINRL